MKRQKVRDRWQIALYVPRELEQPIKREARRQNRASSATVIEILRQYFDLQAAEKRIAESLAKETSAAPPNA
jgi:hypothetical protein